MITLNETAIAMLAYVFLFTGIICGAINMQILKNKNSRSVDLNFVLVMALFFNIVSTLAVIFYYSFPTQDGKMS